MEITPQKYGNRTVYRNTKIKRLIYILSIPILSELIPVKFSLWKTPDRKGMGKGAECHNTQFCGLRSTRATRQDRWKPITNGRKSNTPATLVSYTHLDVYKRQVPGIAFLHLMCIRVPLLFLVLGGRKGGNNGCLLYTSRCV